MSGRHSTAGTRSVAIIIVAMLAGAMSVGVGVAILIVLFGQQDSGDCGASTGVGAASIALGPSGTGHLVGATEYGGPGDPSSGTLGARGDNLLTHPDTYAELGGLTWQTASAMGGLGYMTPLRISWGAHSAIAYKRDFGLGGGPIAGLPRVIDLWWQFAGRLGIPYEDGMWSGPVRVARPPDPGAASVLGQTAPAATATGGAMLAPSSSAAAAAADAAACAPGSPDGVPLTPGERARLLPGGQAAAPRSAPAAVKEMIAAGNQIVGKPYLYGGAHGLPLSDIEPGYDCSSSVEHLLYGASRARDVRGGVLRAGEFRRARTRALGDALRERGSRLHVRRRSAVGHPRRGWSGRRQRRDRLAPAHSQRGGIRGAASGGAVRAWVAILLAAAAAAGLAGCAAFGGGSPTQKRSTGVGTGTAAKVAQAERTHEYPAPTPPRQTASGATSTAGVTAVRRFATLYINWNATTVTRQMQVLAIASIGQARSAMALAAAQTQNDYELRHGGIANRGVVEAVAPLPGRHSQFVVVTREQTTATNTSAYAGLRPAWHVAVAGVTQVAPGQWVVSRWQPES